MVRKLQGDKEERQRLKGYLNDRLICYEANWYLTSRWESTADAALFCFIELTVQVILKVLFNSC